MIDRRAGYMFLRNQIEKTRRNPARVAIIARNYGSTIVRRVIDVPSRRLARVPVIGIVGTQIVKTYRNPARVRSIMRNYGGIVFGKLSGFPIFDFLGTQTVKTYRNPTRVPIIMRNCGAVISGKLSRVPVLGFLVRQAVKTYRDPVRVPRVMRNYSRLILGKPSEVLSSTPSLVATHAVTMSSVATSPTSEARQSTPPDRHAVFQAGVAALNEVRIAEAVNVLRHAATMASANGDLCDLWTKHQSYKHLGVALHHGLGRLNEATCCWREAMRVSNAIVESYDVANLQDCEFYDDFWTTHIGHTALLSTVVMRHILSRTDKKRYLVRPPKGSIGNPYLVEKMGRFFTLVDDPSGLPFPPEYASAFCRFFWIDNRLSGPPAYAWQTLAEIVHTWEQQKLDPLFALSAAEIETAKKCRAELGIPENAWHVCLHVRAPGFKRTHDDLHTTLNAEIATYDLAIAAVVKRGGWVLRMGDPSMPKLPITKHVVDYAHSSHKSPKMDILLASTSRFCISTSSGPAYVPALFGVPSVITNWYPTGTRPLSRSDIFIPKLHWYDNDEEFAPFDESMSQPLGHIHALPILAGLGVSLRPNLREELADAVVEMLDRLDGGAEYSEEDRQLQSYFEKVAIQSGSFGNAHVGRDFLRKYRCLLPSALINE